MKKVLFLILSTCSFYLRGEICTPKENRECEVTLIQRENCMNKPEKLNVGVIDINTLKTLLQSKIELVLIDARASKWDDGQRIPTAISLTNESTPQSFSSLIPNKESLIIVYCSNPQCGASERLAKRLHELGYLSVLKYNGGIDEWVSLGNVVKTK